MAKAKRHQGPGNIAWLDLEMTGLDQERDVIVQAALVVTTPDLEPLEDYTVDLWQPESALASMTPFVRDMHTKTGLLARVRASKVEAASAEKELLERIAGWCPYPALLAGNSIAYDRKFIDRYMPGLAGYLHYRMLDVSSVKVLARTWFGEGAVFDKPKKGKHDALVDVKNSIAELAHYKRTLFRAK